MRQACGAPVRYSSLRGGLRQPSNDLEEGRGDRVGSAAVPAGGCGGLDIIETVLAGQHENAQEPDPPSGSDVRAQVIADHRNLRAEEPSLPERTNLGFELTRRLAEEVGRRLAQ